MESNIFDEMTKAIATATSRREALRRIGGILGGTALAGLFPGLALADNSACAHFCNSVFGGDTPASAQCASDATKHKGLCYSCGPASSGGTKPICCTKNGSGYCTSYSSTTCCGSGTTCLGGSCCANANVCGSTCLAAPCAASQCLTCNPTSGTCVSTCSNGQTCQNGACCTPNGGFCTQNGQCCSGTCDQYSATCV
jgi:hypothetical protein